jgi:AcrR family transcriptional regulator
MTRNVQNTAKVQNTRKALIDVARTLFAKYGKSNVTMNDIAEKSQKGRRTLYTYFANKDEIYYTIIESELEYILQVVRVVQNSAVDPEKKLTSHIISHLDAVKRVVSRNGSLRADFFRDIYEVERIRRNADKKEIEMIKNILNDGIDKGVFKQINAELSAVIIFYAIKGIEAPYIRRGLSEMFEKNKNSVVDSILQGIVLKK